MGSIVDTLKYEFPVTALQFDSRKVIACTGENGVEVRRLLCQLVEMLIRF
jgi:division protein 1